MPPGARCAARAVSASSTTSPAPGARPSTRRSCGPAMPSAAKPRPVSGPPGPPCSGNALSGRAAATPGCAAIRAVSAASTRARSGTGCSSVSVSSPCRKVMPTVGSAATTTGVSAYRAAGTEAVMPVCRRVPQAVITAAAKNSATKVPTKEAGRKRTEARASPLLMPPPPSGGRSATPSGRRRSSGPAGTARRRRRRRPGTPPGRRTRPPPGRG